MDCRKTLFPAVWLLTGALGCSHSNTVPVTPLHETTSPPLVQTSAYSPIKHDAKIVKKNPRPESCVAGGDLLAAEAFALEKGSTAQEQLRNRARLAYQQAMSLDAKNIPAYQGLARLYVDMEDYEHAIGTYQKAIQADPKNPALWFDLGIVHSRRKDWPAALDSLGRASDLDPENRQYVNTLGFALARAGQYQVALACFSRVNNEAQSYFHLARMLHHLKQHDQCRQCLQMAVQKDPKFEPAQAMLAALSAPAATPPGGLQAVVHTEEVRDIAPPVDPRETTPAPDGSPVILPPPPSGL